MKADPLHPPRTPWIRFKDAPPMWRRIVPDGVLVTIVTIDPGVGWHLSISFRRADGALSRYPTWDEIAHARRELLPNDRTFVMFLPPDEDYIAIHKTTFHLHEFPEARGVRSDERSRRRGPASVHRPGG